MISVEKEISRYMPINELNLLESLDHNIDSDELQKVVLLYNNAIQSLKSKSEDIATIELKKAISIYPDFMEAKVLLSLCYILSDNIQQAQELLMSITDSNKPIAKAHRYLQYINNINQKNSKQRTPLFSKKSPIIIKIPKFEFSILKGILFFIAGVLAASIFLSNSFMNIQNDSEGDVEKWSELQKTYKEQIDKYKDDLNVSKEDIKGLKQQIGDKENQIFYLNNVKDILVVEKLYKEGKKQEAVNKILELKPVNFQGVEREKYDQLYQEIMPPLAREYYYKAYALYEAKKYPEAIEMFNKSIELDIKDSNEYQYALYLAGRSYQIIGDNLSAADYYNKVINLYPNSTYAGYSKNRLKQINQN